MAKLPCPPELWPAFSSLLDDALDLAQDERPRWLAGLGPEHAAVLPWLIKVLANKDVRDESEFMHTLVISGFAISEFVAGQEVGAYLLEQRLGGGGMGEVWLASRSDGTLKRQVALKLPHSELFAGVQRRRFERERDILAALSHPNIAQLYDAGVSESQHPYLAMEWVDGVSITQHCSEAKLSVDRRLDLFLQILDAVGYAHSQLIAHRDLKPSNILVTRDERVKLLDFGIAKLLGSETQASPADNLTQVGGVASTPGYAAPEQLAGEPITVAVDLYALGVVLHELLTGQRPFQNAARVTSRTEVRRASSKIDSGYAGHVGGLDAKHLRKAISGDLDAIIAKALEHNPLQRYRTAEAFARDLQLSRNHRPISARRLSFARMSLKFVRRNVLAVSMTAGLLVALLLGGAGIIWQAIRAEHEAQRATATKDFLISVFKSADYRTQTGAPRGGITAAEMLDLSYGRIERGFNQQPETQIELLNMTADIYRALNETKKSTTLYQRETELARAYFGATSVHTIDGLIGQADDALQENDFALASAMLTESDRLINQAGLDASETRGTWLVKKGELLNNERSFDQAVEVLQAALLHFGSASPGNASIYGDALLDLGNAYQNQLEFSKSADYDRQAIALAQQPNSTARVDLIAAYNSLALNLRNMGEAPGAAEAFSAGTEAAVRTLGTNDIRYWAIAGNWAQLRYERGDRQALDSFQQLTDSFPKDRTGFRNNSEADYAGGVFLQYARCLANDGQGLAALERVARAQALMGLSATQAAANPTLQLVFARAYAAAGRPAEARQAYLRSFNQANPLAAEFTRARYGDFLLSQKDFAGAIEQFNAALQVFPGHVHAATVWAEAGLSRAAIAVSNPRAALAASAQALEHLDHIEMQFDIRIQPYVWQTRAQSLLLAGDPQGALPYAQRAKNANALYLDPANQAIKDADALEHAAEIAMQSRIERP